MTSVKTLTKNLLLRLKTACLSRPNLKDGIWSIALLVSFGLVYLPIGLTSGFLTWDMPASPGTVAGVLVGSFWMPGFSEELFFRALLIPHPTETVSPTQRWFTIGLSWVGFILYHLNPATPLFFRDPFFLIGAGLIGLICTLSYLKSGSIWTSVSLHWLIVATWLLCLGGLAKF